MLRSRLCSLVRLSDKKAVDTRLITNAEYQLFLDEMYKKGKHYQPDDRSSLRFPAGQGQSP